MSPTARSLEWLREHGFEVAKTEHWNHFAKIRQDLFKFIDILAVNEFHLLAIQCCAGDGGDHAARVAKIKTIPAAKMLAYHMDIQVWSWAKRGARGEKKVWTRRVTPLTKDLLPKNSLLREKLEDGTWDVAIESAKKIERAAKRIVTSGRKK